MLQHAPVAGPSNVDIRHRGLITLEMIATNRRNIPRSDFILARAMAATRKSKRCRQMTKMKTEPIGRLAKSFRPLGLYWELRA